MAEYSGFPKLAEQAHAINDYFGHSSTAFMAGPVIILATFLYFFWARKKLTWFNGVMIDDESINVVHYEFKKITNNISLIYLQTPGWLYIIYPVTSQDGRKFPNVKLMKTEAALNEVQVELLKSKLQTSTATEKAFWFVSKDVVISFVIFVLIAASAFLFT
ncbi:hypothetical protein ABDD95_06520 [Mucilaginibacter sp. PAMB04274]|uniref:hypothetical protein n=1 Tax=Mucilaginibacter sp. PAMB04274 TaxID=3138568 RepID=UPI0031F645F2